MVKVSEIFDSAQGEGMLIGVPHTFVRLSGCNLSCRWCDTKYAQEMKGKDMAVSEVAGRATREHVCVTGGEPLMQDVAGLIKALFERGKKVTVETNCTIYKEDLDNFVFLYSVSPKLPGSGEVYREDVLTSYLKLDNVQIKFVISDDKDFIEALNIVKKYADFVRDRVIFQPDGMCGLREYQKRLAWLAERVLGSPDVLDVNVRVLPQLHKVAWGSKRGV